jgi:hypothetical protein
MLNVRLINVEATSKPKFNVDSTSIQHMPLGNTVNVFNSTCVNFHCLLYCHILRLF